MNKSKCILGILGTLFCQVTKPSLLISATSAKKIHCISKKKCDRYDSYSLPLVFKNGDQTVKVLKEILLKCKDHLPGKNFGKCLYEKPGRGTTTVYPKLRYYAGKFSTGVYERDTEVAPLK